MSYFMHTLFWLTIILLLFSANVLISEHNNSKDIVDLPSEEAIETVNDEFTYYELTSPKKLMESKEWKKE